MAMKKAIRRIAIYLRKSRDEEKKEDILVKDRLLLTDMADRNGWSYTVFEEVVSGRNLSERPQMTQMLDEIKAGLYDGMLVKDYSRVSRAGDEDFGTILKIFRWSDTWIITKDRKYDPNDRYDVMMLSMISSVSGNEYMEIIERFQNGKRMGAMQGRWTNGKPPYPYKLEKSIGLNERGKETILYKVVIDEEQKVVYNIIKEMYLSDRYGFEKISNELNKKGYPSPGGKLWSSNAVQRVLVHQFHMGIVEYGKTKWRKMDGELKVEKRPDEEVARGIGNHEYLKSVDEHEKIKRMITQNRKVPVAGRAGTYPLTSLLYCKKCGARMSFTKGYYDKKKGIQYYNARCYKRDPFGKYCGQVGTKMDEVFYDAVYKTVINQHIIEADFEEPVYEDAISKTVADEIALKSLQVTALKKKKSRVMEAYEEGAYSLDEFVEKKKYYERDVQKIEMEISELKIEEAKIDVESKDDMIDRLMYFKDHWEQELSDKEKNDLLKTIVEKILYDKSDDIVTLQIIYRE